MHELPAFFSKTTKLTHTDQDLIKSFHTLTNADKLQHFSSDDFRRYRLDRYLVNKQHGIGIFFMKLLKNGIIREVGRKRSLLPSNHLREIRVYEWIKLSV